VHSAKKTMHICLAGCPRRLFNKQQLLAAGCPGCIIIFCHHYTPAGDFLPWLLHPCHAMLGIGCIGCWRKLPEAKAVK